MLKADKRRLFSGFIKHHFQNFMGIRTYLADVLKEKGKKTMTKISIIQINLCKLFFPISREVLNMVYQYSTREILG